MGTPEDVAAENYYTPPEVKEDAVEKIAQAIWAWKSSEDISWNQVADFVKDSYRALANQTLAIIESLGYVPPEEIERQEQRFVEAEKILNREATFEEQRLHDEVAYWKGKNYRLG